MATSVTATQLPLVQLANLFGGQKTTSNAGDTTALQSALSGLQGQNYQAMLDSIFQQAGAKIPGLQASLSNAVGARSGNNAPMAAALADLLRTTSLSAQDQLAKQQLANLQAQVQAGGQVAQATKGTTVKSGTNLGQAAGILALLQGASKLGLLGDDKSGSDKGDSSSAASGGGGTTLSTTPTSTADLLGAMDMSGTSPTGSYDITSYSAPADLMDWTDIPPTDMGPVFVPVQDAVPTIIDTSADYGYQGPEYDYQQQEFADGGLVGRHGRVAKMEPSDTPAAEKTEDEGEARANARFDDGFTINVSFDQFRKLLGDSLGKPEGYADGGVVRAAGSRRSANPTVDLQGPETSMASVASDALKGIAGLSVLGGMGSSGGNIPAGAMMSPIMRGAGASTYASPELGQSLAMASALNNVAKTQGMSGLPSELGLAAGVANANSPKQAAIAGAKYAATTKAGSEAIKSQTGFTGGEVLTAYNTAKALKEGDEAGAINAALWYVSPPVAAVNTLSQMLGGPDVGTVTVDTGKAVKESVILPVVDAHEAAIDFGVDTTGAALDTVGNIIGDAGERVTDAAGNVINKVGSAAGGIVSGAGNAISSAGNAVARVFGWKSGGYIQGPGTGTSDSIPARLSDGEYVIPADVVDKVGVEFFDHLRASLHQPAGAK